MPLPLALVVDDEPINLAFATRALSVAGWAVSTAADGAEAVERARAVPPALIVMDINMPVLDGWGAVAAIRDASHPASATPILAFTTMRVADDALLERGFDGRIAKPCSPEQIAAAAARWRPDGELSGFARLSSIFGADELDPLLRRLRGQLDEALANIDTDQSRAHRIAGAAGTLGFAQVSESWLALSEGDESARDRARHDARMALAAIDRRLGETGQSPRDA